MFVLFFFNDTATTEIYTLSLHDALPIFEETACCVVGGGPAGVVLALLLARKGVPVVLLEAHEDFERDFRGDTVQDRKSTRLNSSHANISYAVFCLKKKKHSIIFSADSAL